METFIPRSVAADGGEDLSSDAMPHLVPAIDALFECRQVHGVHFSILWQEVSPDPGVELLKVVVFENPVAWGMLTRVMDNRDILEFQSMFWLLT